ncbi:MAG TPA: sulfotransferase [Alphaproteobacteria bacterium]|nr:sulfotransferase [Alphaproteobacteria bacterium]
MDPASLIAAACEKTGLKDFGGDSFREGLEVYCRSASSEAQLNAFGKAAIPGAILSALANRLRVVDWAKRHPGIAEERIEAPFVVVGLFRAGTTLLSYLLEKDERHRPLYRWEAGDCIPPPTPETIANDPRIETTRAQMAMMDEINPRMRVVQSEEPDGPTECISIMNQDFKSLTWEAMANVPAYGRWLRGADHLSAYRYHKQVLQVLQSGGVRRSRWTLKCPYHAMHLDALTTVYPDARIILTHRDPVILVTSVCSLITTLTKTFSDADHRRYIADHWTEMLALSIDRADAFRAAHPKKQIVDVHYADLARDPIATMRRIYAAFDEPFVEQARRAMTTHVEFRPKGRFGRHDYDAAEYGLDAGAIGERFRSYAERYDVPLETPR